MQGSCEGAGTVLKQLARVAAATPWCHAAQTAAQPLSPACETHPPDGSGPQALAQTRLHAPCASLTPVGYMWRLIC